MIDNLNISDFGLAGVLVFMVFQYVVKPLIARRNGGDKLDTCKECFDMVKKIHDMHDVRDGDGNLVWWSNQLKKPIQDMTKAAREQTEVMKELTTSLSGLEKRLKDDKDSD